MASAGLSSLKRRSISSIRSHGVIDGFPPQQLLPTASSEKEEKIPECGFQRLDAVDNQATVGLCEDAVFETVLAPFQFAMTHAERDAVPLGVFLQYRRSNCTTFQPIRTSGSRSANHWFSFSSSCGRLLTYSAKSQRGHHHSVARAYNRQPRSPQPSKSIQYSSP